MAEKEKTLRPYQGETYANFKEWYDDALSEREALIALTVGLGKTFTAAHCVNYAAKRGPVLWLTHRIELVDQSAGEIQDELEESSGLKVEIEQAERRVSKDAKIIVASVPTLQKARLGKLKQTIRTPSLIVIDEAHHGIAKTWMRVKLEFPDTKVLNLTATPYRADVRNRMNLGRVLAQKNTSDGIRMGYLVPPHQAASIRIQLKGVKVRLGDFATESLAALLSQDEIAKTCAEAIIQHGKGRKTIVFGADVGHSQLIAGLLRNGGMKVAEVYAATPTAERKVIFEDLKKGRIDAIVNNLILTEGFNLPEIDMVAILRPTRNAALYLQMLGRGLRTLLGKKECLVIDVVDAPKQKGASEDFLLPDEEDAKRFAALAGAHYPKATVFLSWFRRKDEVAVGKTGSDASKLNTLKRLFHAVFGRLPMPVDEPHLKKIEPLYKKDTPSPGGDEDGYKGLLDFLHLGNIEAAVNVMALSGWKYYPRLEFAKGGGGGQRGGGMAIRLEALVENDPSLKNFLMDIFDSPDNPEDKVKEYYQIMQVGGVSTVWYKPIDPLQANLFRYISTEKRIYFRKPDNEKLFSYERGTRVVKDATTTQLVSDIPDHLSGVAWAALPMSPKQTPHVAKMLGMSEDEATRAKISRLVASCLMTGKFLEKELRAIYVWCGDYLIAPDNTEPASVPTSEN